MRVHGGEFNGSGVDTSGSRPPATSRCRRSPRSRTPDHPPQQRRRVRPAAGRGRPDDAGVRVGRRLDLAVRSAADRPTRDLRGGRRPGRHRDHRRRQLPRRPRAAGQLRPRRAYFDTVALDYLDYDAYTIGNHEFDFGTGSWPTSSRASTTAPRRRCCQQTSTSPPCRSWRHSSTRDASRTRRSSRATAARSASSA